MSHESAGIADRIEQNQGLVVKLARGIHKKAPAGVELEDLVAYGQVGLSEAARDFDAQQGTQFSTYAYYRIRGSIYDGLSQLAWGKRATYNQIRYQQMANDMLEGSTADPSKAAKGRDDARWLRDLTTKLAVIHLSTQCLGLHSESSIIADQKSPSPSATVAEKEIAGCLSQLIDELPDAMCRLIRMSYYEGESLQGAGRRLGISKSWASRLHGEALKRLAHGLRQLGAD